VFLGTQVSNWNAQRIERADTVQVLRGLKPELRSFLEDEIGGYYAVTRRYAETAFAGWRGDPGISDRHFVIAAYQASQTNYSARDIGTWSQIFGSDRLRKLDDQRLCDEAFRVAAQALRKRPDLVGEMRWHFAAAATYVENLGSLVTISKRVLHRIEKI
jgi:hypothetical protein